MIICFTDGSSSWKRKRGGSGVYILNEKEEIKLSFSFKNIKTGQSELTALLFCLLKLIELDKTKEQIVLYSDSKYLVNELNDWSYDHVKQKFVGKKNIELLYYLLYLKLQFENLNIMWCKGHQIIQNKVAEGNDIADKLATSHNLLKDEELWDFDNFLADIQIEISKNNIIKFVEENYTRNYYGTRSNKYS